MSKEIKDKLKEFFTPPNYKKVVGATPEIQATIDAFDILTNPAEFAARKGHELAQELKKQKEEKEIDHEDIEIVIQTFKVTDDDGDFFISKVYDHNEDKDFSIKGEYMKSINSAKYSALQKFINEKLKKNG